MRWDELKQNVGDFLHGYFVSEYERKLREQFVDLNDLFMLQCFMELVGLPNPAAIYLLDVYPYFLLPRRVPHLAPAHGHGPIADRQHALLLTCANFSANASYFSAARAESARR